MFELVMPQLLVDKKISNATIAYALYSDQSIWAAVKELYALFINDWTGDVNDDTQVFVVVNGIFEMIPGLIKDKGE